MLTRPLSALPVLILVLSMGAAVAAPDPMALRIAVQQKAPDRHQWDFRRDEARRPYGLFRFLGLESEIGRAHV